MHCQRIAFFVVVVCAQTIVLSGCAKDLIVDMGSGDSIRLVRKADSFECNDPAYSNVRKVETFRMVFADGSSRVLCVEEGTTTKSAANTPVMRATSAPRAVSQ